MTDIQPIEAKTHEFLGLVAAVTKLKSGYRIILEVPDGADPPPDEVLEPLLQRKARITLVEHVSLEDELRALLESVGLDVPSGEIDTAAALYAIRRKLLQDAQSPSTAT